MSLSTLVEWRQLASRFRPNVHILSEAIRLASSTPSKADDALVGFTGVCNSSLRLAGLLSDDRAGSACGPNEDRVAADGGDFQTEIP